MTAENAPRLPWLDPVERALHEHERQGAFLVMFDSYRPDLVRAMAHAFAMRFIDFRAEHMVPLGRDAARLPLARIEEVIAEAVESDHELGIRTARQSTGIVLHNVEALLATRDRAARAGFMAEFVVKPTRIPVLVPISIFASDVPELGSRVVRIDPAALPQEKLLFRLATQ